VRAERDAVKAAGISWQAYQSFMKTYETPIEEERLLIAARKWRLTDAVSPLRNYAVQWELPAHRTVQPEMHMRNTLLLGLAGVMVALPAFAQTTSTPDFVGKAAHSDMLEIQSSQFVAPNADADTKPFAERMIRDHTATTNELKELVQSGKVRAELPSMLDAEHQKKLDDLKKLAGRELDREYDQMQLQAHQDAVDLFDRYAQTGDNNDLKAWAAKTLPHLREHLALAQKLDQGGAAAPTVGAATPSGHPAPGANSFTEGQAKSRIERQGYTNVSALTKDAQGIWRGRAMKGGKSVNVSLDFHGDVFAE
jgi:putative membrane protein